MKRVVSGIKPSGTLTLGNYIGAIKQFVNLQSVLPDYEFYLFVADLHAITVPQEAALLRKRSRDVAAMYLAAGIDPQKTVLFLQSEVKEHAELGYLLQCSTYVGELERMTQYKDKVKVKKESGITAALFTYPVLMAADIIMYDPEFVPVGDDQKQHIELTRDIAIRFNNKYGDFFTVPKPLIPTYGARIMDLQDSTKKMSKSDESDKGAITLYDDSDTIRRKIRSAVTDSLGLMKYDLENQPGLANLITIYSVIGNMKPDEVVAKYQGHGYAQFKEDLAILVIDELSALQNRYHEIIDSGILDDVLDSGRDIAREYAYKKVEKCKRKIGLGRIKK
ncbi:MAG: tryptophan--tRNA ligase [Candidatus Izemoplasmatales bacterium]|jgi:tryptophanyl-tRNA synthetase|nr:tryptophan--tRNA ligase [Candidatus Izemoplasmatales bacterium]MDD3865349.1 tryptophan--tRNA ligase [Candidatus Izemoplasmatales bacterium]